MRKKRKRKKSGRRRPTAILYVPPTFLLLPPRSIAFATGGVRAQKLADGTRTQKNVSCSQPWSHIDTYEIVQPLYVELCNHLILTGSFWCFRAFQLDLICLDSLHAMMLLTTSSLPLEVMTVLDCTGLNVLHFIMIFTSSCACAR